MNFEIVPFIFGTFLVMIIDTFWWEIDYKKAEKGMEAHEHYHIGLELIIVGIFVSIFQEQLASFLFGAGFLFIVGEWRQVIDTAGTKVVKGHPFAFGSTHFKSSSIIGIILTIIAIISYVFIPTIFN